MEKTYANELNTNGEPVNCIIRHHSKDSANLTNVTSIKEETDGSITVKRGEGVVYRAAQGTWQSIEIIDRSQKTPQDQPSPTPYA